MAMKRTLGRAGAAARAARASVSGARKEQGEGEGASHGAEWDQRAETGWMSWNAARSVPGSWATISA